MVHRAAIAGTGFMGWVHLEALRRIGVEVVGCLGSSPQKSQAMANEHGIAKAYASYDELIGDADVDAVHIVTPNKLHFAMTRDAIAVGKHVMCEKPLAMNSTESQALVELASQHPSLITAVNYNIRFYPLCIDVGERIRAGNSGDVMHVHGSYVQDWLLKPTDYNWRVLADEGGLLRAVADIGTHWLDLVQTVTGLHVVEVCADLKTVHTTRQRPLGEVTTFSGADESPTETKSIDITTDDCAHILLRFDNGASGCLTVSQVTAGRKNCLRFEIAGAEEAYAWDSESPNELWIGHRDQPNERMVRDPALLSEQAAAVASYPGGHNEGYADSFKQSFRAFYDAVERGASSRHACATFSDGHREIVLCEAILLSHQERRWIEIGASDA